MASEFDNQILGQYQLLEMLGQGGFAAVYRAEHLETGDVVAVKVLHQHLSQDPTLLRRFEREAQLGASLQHPHIIPLLEYKQEGGRHYLVLPYMSGGSLADYFKEPRRVSLHQSLLYLKQIAEALDYAHQNKVVHRDLKLANVLVEKNNHIRLADFGIAKSLDSTRYTATQQFVGTPRYISPEQIKGENPDHRSDLYAFGVMCYLLLTGVFPFGGEETFAIIQKHLTEMPAPPSSMNRLLPKQLDPVLLKALAKNPNERYQTAQTLVNAIRRALQPTDLAGVTAINLERFAPSHATVVTPPPSQTRYSLLGIGLALVFLVMLVGLLIWQGGDREAGVDLPTLQMAINTQVAATARAEATNNALILQSEVTPTDVIPSDTPTKIIPSDTPTEVIPSDTPTRDLAIMPTPPRPAIYDAPRINETNFSRLQFTAQTFEFPFTYLAWSPDSQFLLAAHPQDFDVYFPTNLSIQADSGFALADNLPHWIAKQDFELAFLTEEGVEIWDFATKQTRDTLPMADYAGAWAVSPLGDLLALTQDSDPDFVNLISVETGILVDQLPNPFGTGDLQGLVWSSNGEFLAFAHASEIALVQVETQDLQIFAGLGATTDTSEWFAFALDSRFFAYVDADNTIHILSLQTGEEVNQFSTYLEAISALTWSLDGYLAAGHADGTVSIWDGSPAPLILTQVSQNLPNEGRFSDLKWSPNGVLLAALTTDDSQSDVTMWLVGNAVSPDPQIVNFTSNLLTAERGNKVVLRWVVSGAHEGIFLLREYEDETGSQLRSPSQSESLPDVGEFELNFLAFPVEKYSLRVYGEGGYYEQEITVTQK